MSQVLDRPTFDDETSESPFSFDNIPRKVWLLHHPASDRYGCFCHDGVHGLAVFKNEGGALRFSEWVDLSGMTTREVDFDEARDVAKSRPLPVVSIMYFPLTLESPPVIHFVR